MIGLVRLLAAIVVATSLLPGGCGASSGPVSTESLPLRGQGFEFTIPPGWQSAGSTTSDRITTYAITTSVPGVAATVKLIPFDTPGEPLTAFQRAIQFDDVGSVATQLNATGGRVVEGSHPVSFVGESCARIGVTAGATTTLSVTCRSSGMVYVVSAAGGVPSGTLSSTLDTMAANWKWTATTATS
jgi:hypothetical protein